MFRAAFPEVAKRRIVLHLGRLNFKKGLDILIGAFANVAGELEDTHLVIAGPDNEGLGIQLRRRLAELGLSRRATFTGMLQGEIKLAAFRDASVFALPSYSENFGIAVVEAMACRVPVVISNRVNIWREVESAGAGLVTECDVDSCAAALLTALKNNERARAMGEKGHELVTARFAWSSVGEKLERIYREIVSGRSDFDAHHSSSVPAIK
jgi:glycosyltransferase involved in cell wall biosynthesis